MATRIARGRGRATVRGLAESTVAEVARRARTGQEIPSRLISLLSGTAATQRQRGAVVSAARRAGFGLNAAQRQAAGVNPPTPGNA